MRSFFLRAATIVLSFALGPVLVHADTLYLSPSSGAQTPGKTFTVNVFVSSLSQAVNAVSGVVTFPKEKLQVISVGKTGSILTLWVAEPSYSNADGTVSFEGVVPNPGFTGSAGKIITINFRAVGQGEASLKFGSAAVLANDGNGTNILKTAGSANFSLSGAVLPVESLAPDLDSRDPNTPSAPVIRSEVFANSREWYSATEGTFNWNVGEGITASRLLLGKLPASDPTVVYEPPISTKKITDLEDGVWYFHVELKNSFGWGGVTHYQFRVDSTKPDSFTVEEIPRSEETDPRPKFKVAATDSTSGISHYAFEFDGGEPITWSDDGSGVYQAPAIGPGKHKVVARAYDEADNFATYTLDFGIEPIEAPRIESYDPKIAEGEPLSVNGMALPNITVHIYLAKKGQEPIEISVKSDREGSFSGIFEEIPNGAYKLYAVAEDKRGAQSEHSPEKAVVVGLSTIASWGSSLVRFLVVILPILALIVLVILLVLWFMRQIERHRRVRRELHEVENLIEKAFDLLKEDIEDSIRLLEHTRSKRMLTREEEDIIIRFRQNLSDARRAIEKEIRDVEREMDRR
jgi:hypothetical protein